MREWLVIQQLSREASRSRVFLELLTVRPLSISGIALLVCLLLALGAVAAIPAVTDGWWTPATMAVTVLVVGFVGGLVLEDRAGTVFQSRPVALHLNGLVRRYRRGFLGPRYILFSERLRETDYFTVDALESALRCCDAELAMNHRGHPGVRTGPAVLTLLVAIALIAATPHLVEYGLDLIALTAGLVLALVAMALIALRSAQPARPGTEETRCLLVWALEEARTEASGPRLA